MYTLLEELSQSEQVLFNSHKHMLESDCDHFAKYKRQIHDVNIYQIQVHIEGPAALIYLTD